MAEKKRIALDVDVDTLETLDNLKIEGNFKSRSKLLNFILPTALARLDDTITETQDEIAPITAETPAPTALRESETPAYRSDRDRLTEPAETDLQSYSGYSIGDAITMFYQNPRQGKIARIWKTSKGYRIVIIFDGNGYAVFKPVDVDRARRAAKERARVNARKNQ